MQVPNPKTMLEPPVVLIAGAGLGGLTAALLLETAGINYMVFERAAKLKPLGENPSSAKSVQLEMLEELLSISLPCHSVDVDNGDLKTIGSFNMTSYKDITGYDTLFFSRPELYELLLSKIPPSKFHMSKKVKSIQQNDEGVMVRCSDNTHYHGDILIGADGAYSGVRQSLYKQLDQKGLLPAKDNEELTMAYLCMVGMAGPLDPVKYPLLKEPRAHFSTVLGNNSAYSWTTITLPGNRISWSAKVHLDRATAQDMMFRNSEWGPEANETMIEEISDFPTQHGGVLGDLIDATDKSLISKVYIEEKLFETWSYGRTALIGDGAVAAMQDAVILVNCIYDIENVTHENIKAALADYRAQRYEPAASQVKVSRTLGKLMYGQKWSERLVRGIVYNLPKWIQARNYMRMASYRPLITFLPPVPNTTNLKLQPQNPSKRYAKEQAARNETTGVTVV
ncbi:hypothetical protein BG003_007123 [Podila horticola]|nr:hypothetical protein BG003_007123 [Podila horticola]